MASETDDTAVTEFNEENAEQTGLCTVEKKKEVDILLLQIKKRKRTEKKQKSLNSDTSWKEFVLRWFPRVFTNTLAIERELEKETKLVFLVEI